MRIGLKVAILTSGKNQGQVSVAARIPETRLSKIVQGKLEPTDEERASLAEVLGRDYFADESAAIAR